MSESKLQEAKASLERVQSFDAEQLPQVSRLGADLSFQDAVVPAQRLIDLFRQFPAQYLQDRTEQFVDTIRNQSDAL
jgi:hypothetical protein